MGRKRLMSVLGATTLVLTAVAGPAAALDTTTTDTTTTDTTTTDTTSVGTEETTETSTEDVSTDDPTVTVPVPGVGSVSVSADADTDDPSVEATVSADAEQDDLDLDADPSVTVGLSSDGAEADAEGQVSLLEQSFDLDEAAAPVEDALNPADEPVVDEAVTPSSRTPQPAPAPAPSGVEAASVDVTSASAPRALPRSLVLREPAVARDAGTAPTSGLGSEPAPQVAPPVGDAVASASLPHLPATVPALLKALAGLLVLGTAVSWSLVRRELA